MPLGAQPLGTPPPLVGAPHTPVVLPACLVQLPPQHSKLVEHTSPSCVQNETALEQTPLLQSFEQQSLAVVQRFPDVRHDWPGFALAHVPVAQIPLQQSPDCWQVPAVGLSDTHCLSAQTLFTHAPVQHSLGAPQDVPGLLQVPIGGAHCFVAISQFAEQHSLLVAHVVLVSLQLVASPSELSA